MRRISKYILFLFLPAIVINFWHIVLAQTGIVDGAILRPKMEYKSGRLPDPFQSPMVKETKQTALEAGISMGSEQPAFNFGSLKVQGIIWGGRIPQAIINNKVLTVGDSINGAKILSIEKNGITLIADGTVGNLAAPGQSYISKQKVNGDVPVRSAHRDFSE